MIFFCARKVGLPSSLNPFAHPLPPTICIASCHDTEVVWPWEIGRNYTYEALVLRTRAAGSAEFSLEPISTPGFWEQVRPILNTVWMLRVGHLILVQMKPQAVAALWLFPRHQTHH